MAEGNWRTSVQFAKPAWRGDIPAIEIRLIRPVVESAVRARQRGEDCADSGRSEMPDSQLSAK
ncbi:hypothetical protein C7S18_09495 [Ahniella affigens]|uniref:Uncharacterized protein n=1 Tax=Ahniella affigens TaxID=2021234 RepID=A0A2P1PRE2_9GAMM|nr:hypothetical protein C7S18_09495 [Ahniella affigens]